jgi:hypothetical protein
VTQYPLIHDLGEKARLWSQLLEHVRNIFLSIGGECLLVAGSSAKRNDNDLSLLCCGLSMHEGAATTHQGAPERETGRIAQEIASAVAKMPSELMRGENRRSG